MNRTRLSSIWTPFYKVVFPLIWIGGLGMGVLAAFLINVPLPGGSSVLSGIRILLLIVWIVGSGFLLWLAMRLRAVWLSEDGLLVRNYLSEIRISLSAVRHVKEAREWRPKVIIVEVEHPGGVSEEIPFLATFALHNQLDLHPTVKQLLDAIADSSEETKPDNSTPNNYPPPRPASEIRW